MVHNRLHNRYTNNINRHRHHQCQYISQTERIPVLPQSYPSFGLDLVKFITDNLRRGSVSWCYTRSASSWYSCWLVSYSLRLCGSSECGMLIIQHNNITKDNCKTKDYIMRVFSDSHIGPNNVFPKFDAPPQRPKCRSVRVRLPTVGILRLKPPWSWNENCKTTALEHQSTAIKVHDNWPQSTVLGNRNAQNAQGAFTWTDGR